MLTNYDDLIYGTDGEKPFLPTIQRVLEEAKADQVRLQIDVRVTPDGVPNSRGEHQLTIDPSTADAEGIMKVLYDRLNESPGEGYSGQIRVNFVQAGSSGRRYGSITRNLRPSPPLDATRPFRSFGGGFRSRIPFGMSPPSDDGVDLGGEDDGELENSIDHLASEAPKGPLLPAYDSSPRGPDYNPIEHPPFVSAVQMEKWLNITMGLLFRSQAQQMAMFERAIGFMDSVTVRYGLPHPSEPGIVETRGGTKDGAASGLGLLPMLLSAAANLAGGKDAAEVTERATNMAQGNAPPPGELRKAAIAGAANLVRNLPRSSSAQPGFQPPVGPRRPSHGSRHIAPTRPSAPADGFPPEPDDDDPDGVMNEGDEGFGAEADEGDLGIEPGEDFVDFDDDGELGDDEPDGDEADGEPATQAASPITPDSVQGFSADEMKEAVVKWIRADPSRKDQVMSMVPALMDEMKK